MKALSKINKTTDSITTVLFIIYLLVLTWIVLLKLGVAFSYMENRQVNLIPFGEAGLSNGKIDVAETLLNVLIFVPMGMYAGCLFRKWNFGKNLSFFLLVSATVEGLQYLLAIGAFDITDLMTNTLGGIIGLGIFKATEKGFNNQVKAQKTLNILAGLGTAIVIVLLVLLKMDMLPIRYR